MDRSGRLAVSIATEVDAATLRRDHVELVFDGLDTFADVYAQRAQLLSANNMFRRWRVPVKAQLHAGSNTLLVTLHSPITRLQPWLLRQPYALPGEFDSAFGDEPKGKQTSNYVRKANYQYGWDWGPRFVTEGIWQPVRLDSWDDLRVADFHIAQQHVDADAAQLLAQFDLRADHAGMVQLQLTWSAPDGSRRSTTLERSLEAGDNHVDLPVRIEHPQRWWPAGYGAPNLYHFRADVVVAGKVVASIERDTGLRSVELRRQHDHWGTQFRLRGQRRAGFRQGRQPDSVRQLSRRASPTRSMQQILQSAHDANMNMLRMWGGGYYQSDAFYEMADKLGLMIWQDFMFGGAIPPYDDAFRENTRIEATEQVMRLRDHPSIVLWCGNNEVQTGWESWPDRKKFAQAIGPVERARVETRHAQPVRRDPARRGAALRAGRAVLGQFAEHGFRRTGQRAGRRRHACTGMSGPVPQPIEDYLKITPRFQSEYGLQSFPALARSRRSPHRPTCRRIRR